VVGGVTGGGFDIQGQTMYRLAAAEQQSADHRDQQKHHQQPIAIILFIPALSQFFIGFSSLSLTLCV